MTCSLRHSRYHSLPPYAMHMRTHHHHVFLCLSSQSRFNVTDMSWSWANQDSDQGWARSGWHSDIAGSWQDAGWYHTGWGYTDWNHTSTGWDHTGWDQAQAGDPPVASVASSPAGPPPATLGSLPDPASLCSAGSGLPALLHSALPQRSHTPVASAQSLLAEHSSTLDTHATCIAYMREKARRQQVIIERLETDLSSVTQLPLSQQSIATLSATIARQHQLLSAQQELITAQKYAVGELAESLMDIRFQVASISRKVDRIVGVSPYVDLQDQIKTNQTKIKQNKPNRS